MESTSVQEIMVPLSEYPTVGENATLYEAVLALESAQEAFDQERYRHRAILIQDQDNRVVGKLSQMDVIKALEPTYFELDQDHSLDRFGLSDDFLKSMREQHGLWDQPVADLCRAAGSRQVKEFMYTPTEGEYVPEDASLAEAVHRLVVGHHHSLLVTRGSEIVGVVRLTDVFAAVFHELKRTSS